MDQAGVAFGTILGLGSGRWIGVGQGGLQNGIGGAGKWPVNRDRPGWPRKLERARKAIC